MTQITAERLGPDHQAEPAPHPPALPAPSAFAGPPSRHPKRWWIPQFTVFIVVAALTALVATGSIGVARLDVGSSEWWIVTTALHAPFALILIFLVAGLIERIGYFFRGRSPEEPGLLPTTWPTVCVQLPMFNEHQVARRAIEAAAAIDWPVDRLSIQVLDDSTDADTRALVDQVCAAVRARTGIDCQAHHRSERTGYKAGALEAGRKKTDAEFLVIFDADFVPSPDFLVQVIPHFFDADGAPESDLAMVQTQWGHLNHDESQLTRAQSLWVDDHHTLQMAWRSATWKFVNFTGTAGVWRASAIEDAGGWRAASLVEDCELSFRHLFAGYRTKFVKEIVAPAELPATYTAYKAQQRRWTQGWVQLQRIHLRTLLTDYRCGLARRLHLMYHMCISWQWALWATWITMTPFLIHTGLWFGAIGPELGLALYVAPMLIWISVATTAASLETRHTYDGGLTIRGFLGRVGRIVPYLVIGTGMLPHQLSAFCEGLFGPLHSEFERTPKAATITGAHDETQTRAADTRFGARAYAVKVHWVYVLTEAGFVALQLAWVAIFMANGVVWCGLVAAYTAASVLGVAYFYGDHDGRVCFVLDRRPAADAKVRTPMESGAPVW